MTKQPREALISLGSIRLNGFPITAIAISPVAPLIVIAETKSTRFGFLKSYILRISNYETSEVVTEISIPCKIDKLSFSPDGKHLLATPINKKNPLFLNDYLNKYSNKLIFDNDYFPLQDDLNINIIHKQFIFSPEGKRIIEYDVKYEYLNKYSVSRTHEVHLTPAA